MNNPIADPADSLVGLANLAQKDIAKIKVGMKESDFNALEFGFYLFPTKKFTILITQGQTTLSKEIEAINANGPIIIDMESPPKPQPPVVPDPPVTPPVVPPAEGEKEYKVAINNSETLIKNGQTITLSSKTGSLNALLSANLDLKLQKNESWIRVDNSSPSNSLSNIASNDNQLRFVASFARKVFEQEYASTKFIFDNYYSHNATRNADFNIFDKATNTVVSTFTAQQVGEGYIEVALGFISSEVGTIIDGKLNLKPAGGMAVKFYTTQKNPTHSKNSFA